MPSLHDGSVDTRYTAAVQPVMPSSTDAINLDHKLLRAEQRYFEQLNAQAVELEEALARCALLKDALEQRDTALTQLQGTITQTNVTLGQVEAELKQTKQLADLQLQQAQEELATCLDLQNYLTNWKDELKNSPKRQIKLLLRTILAQSADNLRWILPIGPLRRHKAKLRQLLIREP